MIYKYINLFSGIGGWELGFADLPMENVLSCEIDKYARQTFLENFPDLQCIKNNNFPTDIRELNVNNIPEFDILVGSPPCQSFSVAGKRLGLKDDKDDKGTMFFRVIEIIKSRRPRAFILENVKGLLTSENGESFRAIQSAFHDIGYSFYYKVIKGSDCGIPQLRPRLFMVGFRDEKQNESNFEFPEPIPLKYTLSDVLGGANCGSRTVAKTLMTMRWDKPFGPNYCFGSYMVDGNVRYITVDEGKMLMGMPRDFKMPVPEKQQQKQLGNGIIVDVVRMVGESVIKYLQSD